ncbi:3-oxoacyl-ACP synthase [Streptomyces sp. AJS327]|uniref:ketoacyl-ACP synthase III family protein n=1 Tax=Streptomyces sp. AJS327 TaxID=2545265 RepID=UPI0015DF9510|nr:ketoacyl-ACP synthase III family protein [Streptomyces sp. AJS327]MBA0052923.1 3-oxoacyl-ACP synthase [Streptomyces sp. AJS327]
MKIDGIYLAATGAHIPPRTSTREAASNGWYEPELIASCGWRNIAISDGVSAPDMAVSAVRQAYQRSGLRPEDIHLLVHTHAYHQGPDGWSAPHYVLRESLGLPVPALTVEQGCNALLAGVEMAASYLLVSPTRSGAVVSSADNFGPPSVDRWHADRDAVLADAGAALILTKRPSWARLAAIDSVSLPDFEILNRGHAPLFPPAVTVGRRLDMNEHLEAMVEELGEDAGRITEDYGTASAKLIERVTSEAGVALPDISRVLHLAAGSEEFLASHFQPMGLDPGLGGVPFFRDIGHAGATDVGLHLDHLVTSGELGAGDHLLMLSAGPGIMVTAAVVEVLDTPPGAPPPGDLAPHSAHTPGAEGEA